MILKLLSWCSPFLACENEQLLSRRDNKTMVQARLSKVIKQRLYAVLVFILVFTGGCRRSETTAASAGSGSGKGKSGASVHVPVVGVGHAAAGQVDARYLRVSSAGESVETTDEHIVVQQLGQLYEHESRLLEFVLSNPSDRSLHIASIAISCPCATIAGPAVHVEVDAHGEYRLLLTLSAAKITLGAFVRTVFIELQNGITQQIRLRGEVLANVDVMPSRTVDIGLLRDSGAAWERDVSVKGVGAIGPALRLADQAESDLLLGQAIAGSEAGSYVLRIRARNSLPYSSLFQTKLSWPVLEPAGMPPLELTIKAIVGDDLRFEPTTHLIGDDVFSTGGIARVLSTCGIIPAATAQAEGKAASGAGGILSGLGGLREERLRNNVDWPALYSALVIELPDGVTVKKIAYEHGIALEFAVTRAALSGSPYTQVIVRRDQHVLSRIILALRADQAER